MFGHLLFGPVIEGKRAEILRSVRRDGEEQKDLFDEKT